MDRDRRPWPLKPGYTTAILRSDMPLITDRAVLLEIEELFGKFFLSNGQLNFPAMKKRNDIVVVTSSGGGGDWSDGLITKMRLDGAKHVYAVDWMPGRELNPEFATEIPQRYDLRKYDRFLGSLLSADWGGIIDSEGRYCDVGLEFYYGYTILSEGADQSLLDETFWISYYHFREYLLGEDYVDEETFREWPEMAAARDALFAVDQYWQETGFTPPPRPKLFRR